MPPRPCDIAAELLTAQQASSLISVGKRTWWRYVSSGKAPRPIRLAGAVRWRRAELMEWIEAGCPSQAPGKR